MGRGAVRKPRPGFLPATAAGSIDVESEVDIDSDDITNALLEKIDEAVRTHNHPGSNQRNKQFVINQFASAVYQCLSGITDEMISELSSKQKEIIANALRKQADRWSK